jgi:hypothetical protein
MRSRDFIICAPGGALTTRMMAREVRNHVHVVVLEFGDAGNGDRRIVLGGSYQSFLI